MKKQQTIININFKKKKVFINVQINYKQVYRVQIYVIYTYLN